MSRSRVTRLFLRNAIGPGRGRRPWIVGLVAVVALVALALVLGLPGGSATERPSHAALPSPSATLQPTATPQSTMASPSTVVDPNVAKLPQFPPAPTPEPVKVPAGSSAGWYTHIPTTQPVAFLTIDDGWTKTAEVHRLLAGANVPVTLFLQTDAIKSNPGFFRDLPDNVHIEAHTITHPELKGKSYASQKHEICTSADRLGDWYGRRPVLFRPPFGDKDATTLKAVHDCRMRAAFFWTETVDKGIVRYQRGHEIRPGDIILMHFRPAFVEDFTAALNAIHKAGLTPAALIDYVN